MGRRILTILALLAAPLVPSASSDYQAVVHKFSLIEHDRLRPCSRVVLSPAELNAYAQQGTAEVAPDGVRNTRLELGQGTATATALIDFGKLRRAQGYQPGWLMSKLLDGERPITATAHIVSGGGKVTVDIKQASISGLEIDGSTLDFLIQNFVIPFYPEAMVGRPVEMGFRIDRLQVAPAGVAVVIGR